MPKIRTPAGVANPRWPWRIPGPIRKTRTNLLLRALRSASGPVSSVHLCAALSCTKWQLSDYVRIARDWGYRIGTRHNFGYVLYGAESTTKNGEGHVSTMGVQSE